MEHVQSRNRLRALTRRVDSLTVASTASRRWEVTLTPSTQVQVQKTPETDAESALLDHVAEVRLFPLEEFIIIFFGRDVELVLRLRFGGFKRTREDAHLHVADFLCGTDGVARLLRLSDGRLDGVAAA